MGNFFLENDPQFGKSTAPAAAVSPDTGNFFLQNDPQFKKDPGFVQSVGDAYDKRLNNVQKISDVDAANGVSSLREAAHVAGEGFGLMKDVGGAGMHELFKDAVNDPLNPAYVVSGAANLIGKGAKAVGLDKAAEYVGNKYDKYIPENTPLRQDLNAAGNFGAVMSSVAPVADAVRVGQAIVPAALDAAKAAPGAVLNAAKAAPGAIKAAFTPEAIATADQIRTNANRAYQYADKVGGTIAPEARDAFLQKVNNLHPPSPEVPIDKSYQEVLNTLNSRAGQPLSLSGAQDIDKYLGDAINNEVMPNGKLSEAGKKILDVQNELREYTRNPDPSHIIGGSQGFQAWQEGQRLWQKQAQMRDVESIFAKADVANNPESVIKNGFGRLANDPKKMRGWDPAIAQMVKDAATSSATGDMLRTFGSRLIPQIAGAVHGLPGAALGQAASLASRSAATALQVKKAAKVARALAKDADFAAPEAAAPLKQLPPPGAGTNFYADNLGNVSRTPSAANEVITPGAERAINGIPGEAAAPVEAQPGQLALPHPSAFDNFQVDSLGNVIPKQGTGVAGTGGLISNAELARMKPADAVKYLNSLKRKK